MMGVFRDTNLTNGMIYLPNGIEGLEEILWNLVWDLYTDDDNDRDGGGPGLVVESDEEPCIFQGEVVSFEYWEDSMLELMADDPLMEDWDIFYDMPLIYEPLSSQETDHIDEIVNIGKVCQFDRVNYQIAYDLSDRDHVHVFPPPGEGFSRSPTRVRLCAFSSFVGLNFDFPDSEARSVAGLGYWLGGELRSLQGRWTPRNPCWSRALPPKMWGFRGPGPPRVSSNSGESALWFGRHSGLSIRVLKY